MDKSFNNCCDAFSMHICMLKSSNIKYNNLMSVPDSNIYRGMFAMMKTLLPFTMIMDHDLIVVYIALLNSLNALRTSTLLHFLSQNPSN